MKLASWFDRAWNWMVYSSANPTQFSGTIKWGFVVLATLFTGAFNLGGLTFPTAQWTSIGDSVIQLAQQLFLVVGTVGTIVSAVRKIWLTIKGQNVTPDQAVSQPTNVVQ